MATVDEMSCQHGIRVIRQSYATLLVIFLQLGVMACGQHDTAESRVIAFPQDALPLRIVNIRLDTTQLLGVFIQVEDIVADVQYGIFVELRHKYADTQLIFAPVTIVCRKDSPMIVKRDDGSLGGEIFVSFPGHDVDVVLPSGAYEVLIIIDDEYPGLESKNVMLAFQRQSIIMPELGWALSGNDNLESLMRRHAPHKLETGSLHIGHRREHAPHVQPLLSISISDYATFSNISVLAEGLMIGAEYLLNLTLSCRNSCDDCEGPSDLGFLQAEWGFWRHTLAVRLFVHTQEQQNSHDEHWLLPRGVNHPRACEVAKIRATIADCFPRAEGLVERQLAVTEILTQATQGLSEPYSVGGVLGGGGKCRRVAVLVHGESRMSRLLGSRFVENMVLPLDADVFIRNPSFSEQSSAKHRANCRQWKRDFAFSGLNLSHFAFNALSCEHSEEVFLRRLLGDRLKSYSVDDPSHAASVNHITMQAVKYINTEYSSLPLDAQLMCPLVGNASSTQRIDSRCAKAAADHWYRLASLATLLTREEAKCEHKYRVIAIVRFDSISFESLSPSTTQLLSSAVENDSQDYAHPHGERILVPEPFERSLYFGKGLDFVVGHRTPMLYLSFNLVWSIGSLLWDMEIPSLWRHVSDTPDSWRRFSMGGANEMAWSLFLHQHARRLNIGFFGRASHSLLTPFYHQSILLVTASTSHGSKGGGGQDKMLPKEVTGMESGRRKGSQKLDIIEEVGSA